MKKLLLLKWDSFVLVLSSCLYGITLITHPQILNSYRVYQLIDDYFNSYLIGSVFLLLGLLKLYGIYVNNKHVKRIALIGLATVWAVFCVSFRITPPPNSIWIFAMTMALLAVGIAWRE